MKRAIEAACCTVGSIGNNHADAIREINRSYLLPVIQKRFVWGTDRIKKLFDCLVGLPNFPIGSFLFWKVDRTRLSQWPGHSAIKLAGRRFKCRGDAGIGSPLGRRPGRRAVMRCSDAMRAAERSAGGGRIPWTRFPIETVHACALTVRARSGCLPESPNLSRPAQMARAAASSATRRPRRVRLSGPVR